MSCSCDGAGRCGCCEGLDTITPRAIFNRPGLPALSWRVGEHADFLETMRSRIGLAWVDLETTELGAHGRAKELRLFPLRGLRTRDLDDPTIALLDLWSVVGDVLSFYTERIAQEGYLRTAVELRSVIELGRLVGYRRRPGVAASVYLAFTADDTWKKPLVIPVGARVQSLPEPGESPVFFETDAALPARAEWNVLLPRRVRPAYLPLGRGGLVAVLYFEGTATRLSANDALLLSYGEDVDDQVLRRVASVEERFDEGRTKVTLLDGEAPPAELAATVVDPDALVAELQRPPSRPPASPARLSLSPQQAFGPGSPAVDGLLLAFHPDAANGYAQARANATVAEASTLEAVSAFRVKASVYGNTAPPQPIPPPPGGVIGIAAAAAPTISPPDWRYEYPAVSSDLQLKVIDLDATYADIVQNSWVVVERPAIGASVALTLITRVAAVQTVSRADYNFPAKVTRLQLEDAWLPAVDAQHPLALSAVRSTTVLAAPELLALAGEPVGAPVCGAEIELDGQADGLQPGRWLVITGERAVSAPVADGTGSATADVFSTPGVMVSELTMLAGVRQDTLWVDGDQVMARSALPANGDSKTPPAALPGDRVHTFLELATALSYCYKRDTVRIYANVAHATHGETRAESLGSGDPTKLFQTFVLKSSPLTYVSAPTTTGVESSLRVYVNDVRWREAEDLLDLGPSDRGHLTSADHDDKTSVIFGDGRNGARLPRGIENVRSVYRSGIGKGGNVRPEQLSQLVTNTEGLRGVVNPQRASGGADPDAIESARERTPLALASLDRLVATRDYADFALLFAGIGKASAARLPSRHDRLVQVTVAGDDDIPIDPTSDLQRNLLEALTLYGDPYLPVRVVTRELLALVIAAAVKIDPDYLWETVRPQLEAALLDRFGFGHRDLAEDAYASQAVGAMQAVPGVDYVDLNLFAAVPETATTNDLAALGTTLTGVQERIAALPGRVTPESLTPLPAQLVVLLPAPATTVLLSEIPDE